MAGLSGLSDRRYHAIHHTKKEANFCLFMPLFDLLGGTIDRRSWDMQRKMSAGTHVVSFYVASWSMTGHQTSYIYIYIVGNNFIIYMGS